MNTFSFRAECLNDVYTFVNRLYQRRPTNDVGELRILPLKLQDRENVPIPDVKVEIQADGTLEDMRDIFRGIPDTHIALQSLRRCPLSENSLERNLAVK